MTTLSIVALVIGVWGQRLAGAFVIGPLLEKRPLLTRAASLIPAAVVMAVVVQLTITRAGDLVIDARLAGLGAAAVLVWRRAPFLVIVISAAAVTAAVRMIS